MIGTHVVHPRTQRNANTHVFVNNIPILKTLKNTTKMKFINKEKPSANSKHDILIKYFY